MPEGQRARGTGQISSGFGRATPDHAGACPYRVQCRIARCDIGGPSLAVSLNLIRIARRRDNVPEGQVKHRRLLDVRRRITQERVPTGSNVGSRDVTWRPLACRIAKPDSETGGKSGSGSLQAIARLPRRCRPPGSRHAESATAQQHPDSMESSLHPNCPPH